MAPIWRTCQRNIADRSGMLRQVWSLYRRYLRQHLSVVHKGRRILTDQGQRVGTIDRLQIRNNQLVVSGWILIDGGRYADNGAEYKITKRLRRGDVPGQDAASFGYGFEVFRPSSSLSGVLLFEDGDTTVHHNIYRRHLSVLKVLSVIRLSARFLATCVTMMPSAIAFLSNRSPAARRRLVDAFGFSHVTRALALDDAEILNDLGPNKPSYPKSVTVIVPVYNAFDLLPQCLERIVKNADLPLRLIIVEDCSTDARVRPYLEGWIAAQDFDVIPIWNQENLGFVKSVNAAFERAIEYDVPAVLINSDAMLPANWTTRLVDPIAQDDLVASVTPLSNNAEITNVPVIVQARDLELGMVDQLDATAKTGQGRWQSAPTGVGFCMALNPIFLKIFPQFDTVFGAGYGEEVDWCQKAIQRGGRNVVQPRLFVEHVGGLSFGDTAKSQKIALNGRIITDRYPGYDASVQEWIATDPILTARLRMALRWAELASVEPVPIYVAHSLGGGADVYLSHKIKERLSEDQPVIVLRVGSMMRWRIEVHCPQGTTIGETDSTEAMQALLDTVSRKTLIFSCVAGDTDAIEIPSIMLELLNETSGFEILLHNFYVVTPTYSFVDNTQRYTGLAPYIDPAPGARMEQGVDLHHWQSTWRPALERATRVVAFSKNSAEIFSQVYPSYRDKVDVVPHQLPFTPAPIKQPETARRCVGILGNLNVEKGAEVVVALGRLLRKDQAFDVVVLGEIDPLFSLPETIKHHGAYRQTDLTDLVERYMITDWLIPSVCPETFSYTTHEAIATTLPVTCFDLGAQAEAVGKVQQGHVLPYGSATELAQRAFVHFTKPLNPT
ncbi:glycosyltransferase [Algirhabdus cladophorae]|uniref:glycosyltransferase n=1 Tax=Algirhabdus cladophorae TaxID=3377108 RepID=UPI003B84B590